MTESSRKDSPASGPLSGVLDSMEFVKQAWASFNVPRNLTPTMDLDEIDRRIADLKVVEQWLSLNLSMLRSAIQGMEMQRGSIAALHSLSEAMTQGTDSAEATARAMAAFGQMQRAAAAAAASGFGLAPDGGSGSAEGSATPASDSPDEPGPGEPAGVGAAETQPTPQADAPPAGQSGPGTAPAFVPGSLADELSKAAVAAINPNVWWKLLQSQFSQVAQAALAGSAPMMPKGSGVETTQSARARPPQAADSGNQPGKAPARAARSSRSKAAARSPSRSKGGSKGSTR